MAADLSELSVIELLVAVVRRLEILKKEDTESARTELGEYVQIHQDVREQLDVVLPVVDLRQRAQWSKDDMASMTNELRAKTGTRTKWSKTTEKQMQETLANVKSSPSPIRNSMDLREFMPTTSPKKLQILPFKERQFFAYDEGAGAGAGAGAGLALTNEMWKEQDYQTRKVRTQIQIKIYAVDLDDQRMKLPVYHLSEPGVWVRHVHPYTLGKGARVADGTFPLWVRRHAQFQGIVCCGDNLHTAKHALYVLLCRDPMAPESYRVQLYVGRANGGVVSRWMNGQNHMHAVHLALQNPLQPKVYLAELVLANLFAHAVDRHDPSHNPFATDAFLFVADVFASESLMVRGEGQLISNSNAQDMCVGMNLRA
jgi:hypothetical protein